VRAEHPLIVALVEAWAHRAGLPAPTVWAWIDRREAPTPEARAAIVDAFYPLVRPDSFLPSPGQNDTIDTMNASTVEAPRRGRPMDQRKHPFVVALLRHRVTIAEVARDLKRGDSTVKSWYKPKGDPAGRPIPRAAAEALRKRFGVPLSAWARIAD